MKWVAFEGPHREPRLGVVRGDAIHTLPSGISLPDLLGDDGERLAEAGERAIADPAEVVSFSTGRVLPPIARPGAFRDHYAFEEHVRVGRRRRGLDMDPVWYELPVFYFSNPHAMLGAMDDLPVPAQCGELDFELEVAAVVGMDARDVKADDADRYLAGFMVLNDWSARDIQRREMSLSLGPHKGKDFGTTIGPYLVTPDELSDTVSGKAFDLPMTATVNGQPYSNGNLADINYSFGEFLEYESRSTLVRGGDLIGSGTCSSGCILELSETFGHERYPWLGPGDIVELKVERLGTQRTRIVAGP